MKTFWVTLLLCSKPYYNSHLAQNKTKVLTMPLWPHCLLFSLCSLGSSLTGLHIFFGHAQICLPQHFYTVTSLALHVFPLIYVYLLQVIYGIFSWRCFLTTFYFCLAFLEQPSLFYFSSHIYFSIYLSYLFIVCLSLLAGKLCRHKLRVSLRWGFLFCFLWFPVPRTVPGSWWALSEQIQLTGSMN